MKKYTILSILIILLLISNTIFAQNNIYLGLGGSVGLEKFMIRDKHETVGSGESLGVNTKIGYQFHPCASVELGVDYLFGFEQGPLTASILSVMPAIKVSNDPSGFTPYFIAGIGYMQLHEKLHGLESYLSDVGGKVGLGAEIPISKALAIDLEGDYNFGFGDLEEIKYCNFIVGLNYKFGRRY